MKTQRLSYQVQIESLYHELHAFSFHEMSEPFRSVKTKNTSAEVSEVETSSGTERSAEGELPLPPSKRGKSGQSTRRSLESLTTQQTTLNQASLIRVPTV